MVSDIGSSIQMVIMPLYIIDSGGSAATVGLFSFLALAPTLVVYPFSGVIGDRLNRKKIMVASDFASALVILSLAFFSYANRMNLTLLLSVQAIVAILYGFFDPATKGMIPQLVAKDELNKTNSKVASLRIMSSLLAPVIGALLYVNLGVAVLFLINGISFLISGSSEMLIKYNHVKRETVEGIKGIISDLIVGIKFIIDNKVIHKLCTFFLLIYALIQPLFGIVLPLFFKTQLEYPDTQYGYIQMYILLGALLGSILVGLFSKEGKLKKSFVIGISLLMAAMFMYSCLLFPKSLNILGNDTTIYFVIFSSVHFLLSTTMMFVTVPVQTYIQKSTPDEYMSRISSIVGMIIKGGIPFGALIYGFAINSAPVHLVAFTATVLMILISIVFLASIIRTKIFV